MEVERTEVHDLAVKDGAVAARIDGGMRSGTPGPYHRRGQVDLEAGKLTAHVIGIDVARARPKPARRATASFHFVGHPTSTTTASMLRRFFIVCLKGLQGLECSPESSPFWCENRHHDWRY